MGGDCLQELVPPEVKNTLNTVFCMMICCHLDLNEYVKKQLGPCSNLTTTFSVMYETFNLCNNRVKRFRSEIGKQNFCYLNFLIVIYLSFFRLQADIAAAIW